MERESKTFIPEETKEWGKHQLKKLLYEIQRKLHWFLVYRLRIYKYS